MILNPLTHPNFEAEVIKRKLLKRHYGVTRATMDGFLSDVGDFLGDAISGLAGTFSDIFDAMKMTVKKIGETIALTVRAVIGDVKWDDVSSSLGEVFQNVANVVVVMNPYRNIADFARENEFTAHAFSELDKFTAGMLTNGINVSDVANRAMRGDPISKEELIKDAMFIIQVFSVVFGGPAAAGLFVGNMVGREVCSHQTEAKDACLATFQIIGLAAGEWGAAVTDTGWGTAYWNSQNVFAPEGAKFVASDAAYQAAINAQTAAQSASFFSHLTPAMTSYLTARGIDEGTQALIRACQEQSLLGDRECEIMAEVAGNFVRNELIGDKEWDEFLADEIARIGVEELMLQWFPEDSKEHQAIRRRRQIIYVDQPPIQLPAQSGSGKGALFLLAAGVGTLLLGASV